MGCGLMARHSAVNRADVGSNPTIPAKIFFAGSSNGRTAAFDAVNLGSSPSPATNFRVNEYENFFW